MKKDCYYYAEQRDMGATIPRCNYDKEDHKWWCITSKDCKDCPHFISRDNVEKLVRGVQRRDEIVNDFLQKRGGYK